MLNIIIFIVIVFIVCKIYYLVFLGYIYFIDLIFIEIYVKSIVNWSLDNIFKSFIGKWKK